MKAITATNFSKHHIFGSFIEITSGEQFVPMFLAFMSNKTRLAGSDTPSGDYIFTGGSVPHVLVPSDKDKIKEFYLKDAEAWGIKKYSLYLDVAADGTPTTRNPNMQMIDPSYMMESTIQYERNTGIISAPYYGGIINPVMYTTLNSHYVNSRQFSFPVLRSEFVKSNFLVVVKAKHLNYIRTCFLFDAKADIPVSDIKCLRIPILQSNMEMYFNELRSMMTVIDMTIEYTSFLEINKYLMRPSKSLSREQIVGNVKRNYYNNLVNFKPIVFND